MIRLNIPYTDDREIAEIRKVMASGYLTQGEKSAEFENIVADYVGSKYAFAMSSCTTALHLSLVVLGIKSGDEVLVADFTFPATANVVVQQGAIPVFVDIELDTFTIDIDDLRSKVTNKTKAIIPVHTFGCSADMDKVLEIASEKNIPVIEDAACAIGTIYKGKYCGNLGTLGCFSFHPRKVITTGEGGMITTNDEELAERIRLLRNHGGVRIGKWYQYEAAGFNYRLSDVQAAIGVVQMEKLPYIIKRKRQLAGVLREKLRDINGIHGPNEPPWGGHIYQSFVIRVDKGLDRDQIIMDLLDEGVEATLGTYALHDQPFYRKQYNYTTGQLSNSHHAFEHTITLPLFPQMEDAQLDIIADNLRKAVRAQL